jgi:hypothetical protein
MNVSEVLDIKGSSENSKKLVVGDKITIQGFHIKTVDEVGAEVAEISTTEGLRHSFGKAIIGQAKSAYWVDVVEKCVDKDAADGLDAYIIEKEAEKTGRMMLCLSMFPPKA